VPSGPRWVVVQHVAHEGPGAVGEALISAGHDVSLVRVDRGEPLPGADDLGNLAGLVVMGGPMGVHDEATFPWLAHERRLMTAAVRAELPVLGICLGAQQLALALGGQVTTGPQAEIGVGQVHLTGRGLEDPVCGPAGADLPCLHWHGDTFSLPEGGVLLAGNEHYPHQAFRFGQRAYGLQFHVELTPTLAAGWRSHLPSGVTIGVDDADRISAQGRPLVARFVALA
jgi:GMP synthase-like glutamine amidotransferase